MKTKELKELREYCNKHGGLKATGEKLGVTPYVMWVWIARGQVPTAKALRVEEVTGVSRRYLRPNDWFLIWPELAKRK